jgi:hypothetical protein
MTVAGHSTRHHYAVGAAFKCMKYVFDIYAPGTLHFDDFYRRRVLNAQTAGEIGSVVGAVTAAKCDNLRFEFGHIPFLILSVALLIIFQNRIYVKRSVHPVCNHGYRRRML